MVRMSLPVVYSTKRTCVETYHYSVGTKVSCMIKAVPWSVGVSCRKWFAEARCQKMVEDCGRAKVSCKGDWNVPLHSACNRISDTS